MTKSKWLLVWCVILLQVLLAQKIEAVADTYCQIGLGSGTQPAIIAADTGDSTAWVSLFQKNEVVELTSNCSIVRYVATGVNPYGVAYDGKNIWVSNNGSNTVTKIQASTGTVLATVSVGSHPRGVVFDGINIWVANYGSDTVSVINPTTNTVIKSCGTGSGPYVPAVLANTETIWIPNRNSNTITVLATNSDTCSGFSVQTDGEPQFVASDGIHMWVSCYSAGRVQEFSSNGTLLMTVNPTASGQVGGPTGIAWVGAYLWGASNSGWVYSIDANGNVGNITQEGGSGNAHIGVTNANLLFNGNGLFWTADTGGGIVQLLY